MTIVWILLAAAAASLAIFLLRKRLIASAARPRIDIRQGVFAELANRELAAGHRQPAKVTGDGNPGAGNEPLELPAASGLDDGPQASGGTSGSFVAETAATLGLVGAMSLESWHAVDPAVYQTIAQLTHQNVTGFWDLAHVVDTRHYDLANEAFARNLGGHVAEFHFRDDLIQSGVHVHMPAAANNPGWDLQLNGDHLLNVKNHADVAHAAAMHFATHSDVAIGVPSDAHGIPAHALHFNLGEHFDPSTLAEHHAVLVDNAMHLGDGAASVHHAADLLHVGGVPDHAFPVATVIISSYREGRKYFRGDTNAVRASTNVVVDAGGVAIGAKGGAITGGVIGAHFGGVGAVPGAAIGAVVGAIAGKFGAHEAKEIPLRNAENALKQAVTAYQETEVEAAKEAQQGWKREQARWRAWFHLQVRTLESKQAGFAQHSEEALADVLFLDRASASATIAEADTRAQGRFECWRERKSSWPRRLFTQRSIEAAAREFEAELQVWNARARDLLSSWKRDAQHTEQLFDLVLAVPGADELAEAQIARAGSARARAYGQLAEAAYLFTAALAEKRAEAVARLRGALEAIQRNFAERLDPLVERLEAADKCYQGEMRKAGKKLPAPEPRTASA